MRFKFLLFLIFASRIVGAQCDYPSAVDTTLIISEARLIDDDWAYVELTNVGSKPIFLNNFKIGKLANLSWSAGILDLCNDPWWMPSRPAYFFLPEKVLLPGQSWVFTTAYDFGPEFYKRHEGRLGGDERPKNPEWYEVADKLFHRQEAIGGIVYPGDSISNPYDDPEQTVKRGEYANLFSAVGGGTFFLEHHYTASDSAVVDQVGGFFDSESGRNIRGKQYDVAGVYNAMGTSVLVRKNTIKSGNLDFANSVGISYEESDWMPIQMPSGYDHWRDLWWTIGNHGDYVLDATTLEPTLDGLSVDFANKEITVPWGVRRLDDIMRNMKKKKGVAWNYVLNDVQEDSLYRSARTGDKLIIYIVGDQLTTDTFDIIVSPPTADANIVVPIDHPSLGSSMMTTRTQNGILDWPRVTTHESGTDTITGQGFGLEFDLRVDSLLKYLEKPANATWEIVWVDGVERADFKNGDKLKVTSENGSVKEYFIELQTYLPSNDANLSAITWPDIPEQYRNVLGWTGDTIPTFSPGTYNYKLEVPFDVDGVPAFVATTQDYNATIKTTRARSVTGSKEDRTVVFEVTAEDDSTTSVYSIELVKEKHPDNVEPFFADPFFSEWVNSYTRNCYLEIYNPGTLPVDLRNYAFGMQKYDNNPYGPILSTPGWLYRYTTYIPGLKFVDSLRYEIEPEILIPDVNVNPILQPGECFVMARVGRDDQTSYFPPYDVNFINESIPGHPNPWNENVSSSSSRGTIMPPNGNRSNSFYMYKVLNDSIKQSLKPIQDPNDFEVIDMWGMEDGGYWIVGDHVLSVNGAQDIYKRKPHITKGNPIPGGALAPGDPEACEWIRIQPGIEYPNLSGDAQDEVALGGVGSHFMEPITAYRSTLNSMIYKISPGYGEGQEIRGLVTGTTIAEFLTGIYKEDEDQTLTFTSGTDTLTDENAVLAMDDVLIVLSADSSNTTWYRLDVTAEGLSTNAVLSSARWSIDITVSPNADEEIVGEATIGGFDYGTTLETIMDNINVPSGASVTLINSKGNYVPMQKLNYDTVYVSTTVSPDMAIDVVAEDSRTRIVYELVPNTSESDAFILSDVYQVSQDPMLIEYVPLGVAFDEFLNNIIPSKGATLKLVDKLGLERTRGEIKADDKVMVTSANGEVTNVYLISLLIPGTESLTYLAFVKSDFYAVDNLNYSISGTAEAPITASTTVAEFMQRITPAAEATVEVIDADGNVKTTGNMAEGDYIKVTSGDGVLVSWYAIILNTSSRMPVLRDLNMYPNPTDGQLNFSGLNPGNRIRIYSTQGQLLREIETHTDHQTISLDNVPEGLFLIIISDEHQVLGQFKAVKK